MSGEVRRKRKLHVRIFIGVLILLGVLAIILVMVIQRDKDELWFYIEQNENLQTLLHVEKSTLSESDIFFVTSTFGRMEGTDYRRYLPGHYIWQLQMHGRASREKGSLELLQYYIHIYDAFTKELSRTVDLVEIMNDLGEEIEEGYSYSSSPIFRFPTVYEGEQESIHFQWTLMQGSHYTDSWIRIRFNERTGEASIHQESEGHFQISDRDLEFRRKTSAFVSLLLRDIDGQSFLAMNGIETREVDDFRVNRTQFFGIVSVELWSDFLPEESESLYSRFPGLRQFQGQEGKRIHVILADYPTAEEIMELFMEDGREISFEGVIMPGNHSIDGEEHEIHSFEDYFRLRDMSGWWRQNGGDY